MLKRRVVQEEIVIAEVREARQPSAKIVYRPQTGGMWAAMSNGIFAGTNSRFITGPNCSSYQVPMDKPLDLRVADLDRVNRELSSTGARAEVLADGRLIVRRLV